MSAGKWLERLGERSRIHYGLLVLLALLVCGGALCAYFVSCRPEPGAPAERAAGPATFLSWLPEPLLRARALSWVCGGLFVLGALLWAAQRALPWSGWLTALSYNAAVALFLENARQATHVGHITGVLLLLYALWYQLDYRAIRTALAEGRFWSAPLYPRWVHSAGVFYIGLFYGMSGLVKWLTSGPGWANGTSLQLWARLFGDPHSWFTQAILADRRFALLLQWSALIGETSGLLAVVSRRARPWVGLLLIGFHVGQILVFGWGFHANMALIALLFLPFDEWVPRWAARLERGDRLRHWRVVLYTRRGCHLCECGEQALRRARRRYGFVLEEADVDADPALAARYGERVPVVTVNGKERFRGGVNAALLERLLRAGAEGDHGR
jgi:hypothetical protein